MTVSLIDASLRTIRRLAAVAWVLGPGMGAACQADDDGDAGTAGTEGNTSAGSDTSTGGGGGAGTTSGGGGTGGDSGGSTDAASTGGSGGPGGGSTTSGGVETTASTTGEGTGSGATGGQGTGGQGTCEPEPGDSDCITCVKTPCCSQYTACRSDAICSCTLDCVLGGASSGSCASRCGGSNDLYRGLYFCGQQTCLGTCDWSKP